MRGAVYRGERDIGVEELAEPSLLGPSDAIVRVTLAAVCGSDLHFYRHGSALGFAPGERVGHEFMGVVEEVGPASTLKKGQRVVVPFTISCGTCYHCSKHQYSACENGNPAENQDIGQPGDERVHEKIVPLR